MLKGFSTRIIALLCTVLFLLALLIPFAESWADNVIEEPVLVVVVSLEVVVVSLEVVVVSLEVVVVSLEVVVVSLEVVVVSLELMVRIELI